MTNLKYCPECGAQLDEDAVFCNTCGADLREREKADVEPHVQEPEVVRKEEPKPQGVKPSYQVQKQYQNVPAPPPGVEYATFGPRLLAFIIDIILISIISGIISSLLPFELRQFWRFAMSAQLISFILYTLYFWGLEAYNSGQTLGKMAMRLRTVDKENLEVADTSQYLINNLFRAGVLLILDIILGILINSGDPQQKLRLAQNLSRTVVIREHI
ncbi:MAG: RDD family protein [Promethearchaeia archaeon]